RMRRAPGTVAGRAQRRHFSWSARAHQRGPRPVAGCGHNLGDFAREERCMSKTTLAWSQEIDRRLESLVALRRDFHRHPELSFQEHRTAEIIAERLHAAGFEVHTGIGGTTGVMGILHGDKPGRTIAWRADIDALPLTELLEAPFASGTPGVMHACGHDGHTAIAITLAEILAARRAEVPG